MFGREHDEAGILVEPSQGREINVNDTEQLSRFRNDLWYISYSSR